MKRDKLLGLFIFLSFFLVGVLTVSDYGINWDEPGHLMRGSAYLYYFITGQTEYKIPEQNTETRRSYYQVDSQGGTYYLKNDRGHPPLNGILAALTNYIFYQKLGVFGDVESFHLFIILASSVLVLVVYLFASEEYGVFAGLVSALSLILYPLFFSESHFNIKDPVEACFFGLTIYAFYLGIKNESWKWFLLSAVFCGVAFGTKFNILSLPFIILPWLIFRYFKEIKTFKQRIVVKIIKLPLEILITLVFYPLIVVGIFYATWPFLWKDPIVRFLTTLGYYEKMGGSGSLNQPLSFYFHGFNTYPIKTIIFTTPLVVLAFSIIGIILAVILFRREKQKTSLLWLIWLVVPVLRVSVPGSSIYGGTRQIMEFIPAMALFSGLGASYVAKQFRHNLAELLIVLMFVPIGLKIINMHPNQNVYFNPLIGGLKGAQEKDYPYWGLTLGTVFKQGVEWLNHNAEKDAKVALVIGTALNVPKIYFREDIKFYNGYWSGVGRKGEYIMEAVSQDWIREWYYSGEYVDRLLKPVYEVKVEGVPILKIWKNSQEYIYPRYLREKQLSSQIKWDVKDSQIFLELPKAEELMMISWFFNEGNCAELKYGQIEISQDGEIWQKEGQELLNMRVGGVDMVEKGKINYPLAAKKAKFVRIEIAPKKACALAIEKVMVNVANP